MSEGYDGVVGAVPFALRRSDSWVFRSYAVVGALATLVVGLLVLFGLIVLVAATASIRGGSLTLSRAFYAVVGLLVAGPLLAPILLVARRHRTGEGDAAYDTGMALAGYLFLGALYVGLVVSVPPAQQAPPTGVFAPVIGFLYSLPQLAGVVPPVVAAGVMGLIHRRLDATAPP